MIQVVGVSKRYGAVQALDAVGFAVPAGQTLGVIGPNGAGKTTLLKILLGLVRPDTGTVTIDGTTLARDPIGLRRRIGYVPQHDGFEERSTGRQALDFLARLRGVGLSEVEGCARAVGVDHLLARQVGTLSGGQRQRLSVAAALLGAPPVMLFDEPTASLDPRATASFRDLVGQMGRDGRTILLCSHLLGDVERLCDRVIMLLDGKVAAQEVLDQKGAHAVPGGLEARFLAAVGKEEDHGN